MTRPRMPEARVEGRRGSRGRQGESVRCGPAPMPSLRGCVCVGGAGDVQKGDETALFTDEYKSVTVLTCEFHGYAPAPPLPAPRRAGRAQRSSGCATSLAGRWPDSDLFAGAGRAFLPPLSLSRETRRLGRHAALRSLSLIQARFRAGRARPGPERPGPDQSLSAAGPARARSAAAGSPTLPARW